MAGDSEWLARSLVSAAAGFSVRVCPGTFDYWFNKAVRLIKFYNFGMTEKAFNEAAFQLHQVTESLYGAILLVFTRYKPSTHDLAKLAQRVASVNSTINSSRFEISWADENLT